MGLTPCGIWLTNGTSATIVIFTKTLPSAAVNRRSSEQHAHFLPQPSDAPSSLVLTLSGNTPTLSWYPNSYSSYYQIYRATSTVASGAPGSYSLYAKTTNTSYIDQNPAAGLNYYQVRAMWGTYQTSATNTVFFEKRHAIECYGDQERLRDHSGLERATQSRRGDCHLQLDPGCD